MARSALDGSIDRQLSAYDYHLPEACIAQHPASPRDRSRLLVVDGPTGCRHQTFCDLPQWLRAGDLLVLNNTRVIPARLIGRKASGLAVEVFLLEERGPDCWHALVKPGKRLKPGVEVYFDGLNAPLNTPTDARATGSPVSSSPAVVGEVLAVEPATGGRLIKFRVPDKRPFRSLLPQLGQVPLPPYITSTDVGAERYQTVYGDRPGAVAAPTAGLHFTPELLQTLEAMGVGVATLTLHVGIGTFRPVEREDIAAHKMHGEWIEVTPAVVAAVQQTRARGGRVIAVGTTSVRALEGAAQGETLQPYCGQTSIFIYPGYRWRVIDGLITNFHLPKSSLMMMVSALIGRQRLLDLYQLAIAQAYRFYSFGDAMLILPEAQLPEAQLPEAQLPNAQL
ncbi:MAG: tRNA preQ1(34) S-adenosylmethionine ribosyltransferase-isomerase QueA [Elainellaceae cyanobacterium]